MNLRIPGPTPCPPEVLAAMSAPMVDHRGPELLLQLAQRGVERLRHELAAELLEVTARVGVPERLLQPARRAVGGVAGGGRGG